MSKALFLDRDGTLIRDKSYLSDPEQVELLPGTAEALRLARELGFLLFLFTNQSGVGRRYFTLETVHRVNARMEELLGLPPPVFAGVCIAPETPDEPQVYRKPSPRFILEMIGTHRLDPRLCFMVGDAPADIQAALNAGITPIAVTTGAVNDPRAVPGGAGGGIAVFPDLLSFVRGLKQGPAAEQGA